MTGGSAEETRFLASEEQQFFQQIEDLFVTRRGAPLLLTPKDWHVARAWWQEQIPLGLIAATLDEIFERRENQTKEVEEDPEGRGRPPAPGGQPEVLRSPGARGMAARA